MDGIHGVEVVRVHGCPSAPAKHAQHRAPSVHDSAVWGSGRASQTAKESSALPGCHRASIILSWNSQQAELQVAVMPGASSKGCSADRARLCLLERVAQLEVRQTTDACTGKGSGAHERPRESGSFRMSAMTLFWYCGPIATMEAIRFAQ